MLGDEEIRRLEQVWLVLSGLFQDLRQRDICVDVASDLRDCKTLIHLIRTGSTSPPKDAAIIEESFRNLMRILGKVRSCLVSEAMKVDQEYLNKWLETIDMAERAEMGIAMIYGQSKFVPSLPRDPEERWVKLSLQQPVAEERVEDVAEQFGVIIEFKDDCCISISGRQDSVRKAARDIYELSLEETF